MFILTARIRKVILDEQGKALGKVELAFKPS